MLSLAPLALALAPAVHVVDDDGGPGVDFTSLVTAVDAAASGDILLVRSGSYSGSLNIDGKALTIVADAGAVVAHAGRILIENLPTGSDVHLSGLTLVGQSVAPLVARNCSGSIWVGDCSLTGPGSSNEPFAEPGASFTDCQGVFVEGSVLQGGSSFMKTEFSFGRGGSGALIEGSRVAFVDCELIGGFGAQSLPGAFSGGPGGDGLTLNGSDVTAAGSTVRGGSGGAGGSTPPFGCADGGQGGACVRFQPTLVSIPPANSDLALRQQVFLVGPGGGSSCGASGAAGVEIVDVPSPFGPTTNTVTQFPGMARRLEVSSPVRGGQTVSIDFDGRPGDLPFVLLGAGADWLPVAGQAVPLAVAGLWGVTPLAGPDATGHSTTGVPLGLQAPGFEGATVPLQLVTLEVGVGTLGLSQTASLVILSQTL